MISWDPTKRNRNLVKHGIDLAECETVFDAPMLTREDARVAYGEQRFRSLCWLHDRVAVLVWTDQVAGPHLISCRYGDKHETQAYFQAVL